MQLFTIMPTFKGLAHLSNQPVTRLFMLCGIQVIGESLLLLGILMLVLMLMFGKLFLGMC